MTSASAAIPESADDAAPPVASARPGVVYYFIAAAGCTAYSICQLAAGRMDPQVNAGKMLRGVLRRHVRGRLDPIHHETGHCYTCSVPRGLLSDAEAVSRLVIYEDGVPIGPAHASHNDVRAHGGGRYSHWSGWLYFSTPDNSDPRSNGRQYTFKD